MPLISRKFVYGIGLSSVIALGGLVQQRVVAAPPAGTMMAPAVTKARNFAILVGISNYGRGIGKWETSWPNLHTSDDIAAVQQVLRDRFGFPAANLITVTDAAATRKGIIAAFQKLIAQARPGDNVVFYFAGHGQQLRDTNGNEPDGLDESLVPYDYLTNKASDGAKTNLTDDQLAGLLDQLRAKMSAGGTLSGSITLFLDCGWGGPGNSIPSHPNSPAPLPVRGRAWKTSLDGPLPTKTANTSGGFFASGFAQQKGYTVLTAAGIGQPDREVRDAADQPVGALTYYLARALNRAQPDTSYDSLLQSLNVGMGGAMSAQTPQLEGNPAQSLLGGSALPLPAFVTPSAVDAQGITLPIGALQCVTVGSVYTVYPEGSALMTKKNLLAEVSIASTTATTSRAQLTTDYAGKVALPALKLARLVESSHNYVDSPLKLALNGVQVPAETLTDWGMVTTTGVTPEEADLTLKREGVGTPTPRLILVNRDGTVVARALDNAEVYPKLKDVLEDQNRLLAVSRLHNDNAATNLKVEMRIIPVNAEADANGIVTTVLGDRTDVRANSGSYLVLKEGDYLMAEFKNSSPKDVYVTVLDLSPDGSIAQLYPDLSAFSSEQRAAFGEKAINRIPADGQWHRAPMPSVFKINKPYGKEMFKALITPDQADFHNLLQKARVLNEMGQRGAPSSSLGRMLLSSSTGKRGQADDVGDNWSTAEVTFLITPR